MMLILWWTGVSTVCAAGEGRRLQSHAVGHLEAANGPAHFSLVKVALAVATQGAREIPVDAPVVISAGLLCDEALAVPTELALPGSGALLLDRDTQDAELSLQRVELRGRRVLALFKQPFEAGEPAHVRVR